MCIAIGFFFFFFFLHPQLRGASLPAPVSNGMSPDYEAEKGTALRESVQLTPVGQMKKPLSIESWRNIYSESTVSGGALHMQKKIWASADFQNFLARPNTRRPRKKPFSLGQRVFGLARKF